MPIGKSRTGALRVLPAVLALVAIGLGASGARGQTATAPAPVPQMYEYAVKFVCGRSLPNPQVLPPVAPGFYFTAVNVHNPNLEEMKFRKKFALALPNQKAGMVSKFFPAFLKADEAFEVDCAEITKGVEVPPGRFVKGFVIFQSPRELDIVAVYTTAATPTGNVLTMAVERVPKRP